VAILQTVNMFRSVFARSLQMCTKVSGWLGDRSQVCQKICRNLCGISQVCE